MALSLKLHHILILIILEALQVFLSCILILLSLSVTTVISLVMFLLSSLINKK